MKLQYFGNKKEKVLKLKAHKLLRLMVVSVFIYQHTEKIQQKW